MRDIITTGSGSVVYTIPDWKSERRLPLLSLYEESSSSGENDSDRPESESGVTSFGFRVVDNLAPAGDVEGGIKGTEIEVRTERSDAVDACEAIDADYLGLSGGNMTATILDNDTAGVNISADDNNLEELEKTVVLSHSVAAVSDSNFLSVSISDVTLTIIDNDTPDITLDKTNLQTDEAGKTDTFTVKLNTIPTAQITISFTVDASEGSLSPDSLTFSANETALEPVTVNLTGVDDTNVDGNVNYTITATPSSSDANYNASPGKNLSVVNTDNQEKRIYITEKYNGGLIGSEALGVLGADYKCQNDRQYFFCECYTDYEI